MGERAYAFSSSLSADSTVAASTNLVDSQANAGKSWAFDTQLDNTQGLVTAYTQYQTASGVVLRQLNYTWAQDPVGRNYIGRSQDIANPNQPSAVTRQIDQTLDQYGNTIQTKLYAYNNLSMPTKTYTNIYLSGANYNASYTNINNRLLSSTVSDSSGNTLTLVSNTYDASPLTDIQSVYLHDYFSNTSSVYRGNITSSISFAHVVNTQYDITGAVVYTDDGNANHGLTITNSSAADYAAPAAITTANSMTTTFTWSSALSPLSTTGPNGDTASTSYDPTTSQPTSSTSPYGAVTTYTYSNTAPQIVATVNGGAWKQTFLDGLGRTSRVAKGNGDTTLSYADTVYDTCGCTPVGKPYKTSLPYPPNGTAAWKVNTYDALGRTLTTVAPDGSSTTTYSYAGSTVTVADPTGKWKQYTTDAFGELVQVTEQSPNPSTEPNHVTTYTYDLLGHLIQAQMPRTIAGQVVTQTRAWTYDPNSQLLTKTNFPESGTTQFTYNSDGTLATKTDAKSQQIQYTYDAYGRVIQISRGTVSNGQFTENAAQRTTLAYDGSNGGFSSNTLGRLSQVSYSGPHGLQFTEWYSYHPAGAITAKQLSVGGTALGSNTANFDATYAYNNLGQVTSVQYPFAQWSNGSVTTAGPQYGYTYDAMNRLNGMTEPNNQTLVSSVSYGAANQLLQLNAASFTEARTYNANLQLTSLASGSYQYNYNYSATQNNGRIQSISDVASGETITYQYDSLNRLIQASGTGDAQGAWSQTFTFDGFGNLTQKTGSNAPTNAFLATNPANNQLTANGAQYDANGNLTSYGTGSYAVAYAYDIENRLSSALPSGTSEAVFGYDNSNQRVYQGTYNTSSAAYSNELIYFYGADNKKLACWSLTSSGSTYTLTATITNVWFAGRLLTPEDRLQSRGKYFPFGEDRYNPNQPNPSNDQEKFATYTRDSATGLDYGYQRYYASTLGRFMSADISNLNTYLGAPVTWNAYSYIDANPIYANDPSGLFLPAPSLFSDGDLYWDPFFVEYYPYIANNPGGGGGTSKSVVTVTALTKSGPQYNQAASVFKQVSTDIDPQCLNFLQSGGQNVKTFISDLLSEQMLAVANFNTSIAAFTGTAGTNIPAGTAAIVINGTSAFYSSKYTVDQGKITGGTPEADAFIILHELGHALDAKGFLPDNNNPSAVAANDQLIAQNCKQTLAKFQ